MLIIFDKTTGKRVTDFGTNALHPEGVPYEPQPNEVVYRINDNDPFVERYLVGDLLNVTAVIENGEVASIDIPEFVPGPPQLPSPPTELELANKKIETLEAQLSQTSTDFQDFMSFYFENNPNLA